MNPFYFGSRERRLFGLYEPARAPRRCPRAAVICQPWGQEYLRAHRSVRQLALTLAAAGFDTLRFDYFGTGDSAGESTDVTLEGCQCDVEAAVEEVKASSGAERTTLVGLRMGGYLAALESARRPEEIDALVMWDPVISGQEHLRELHQMAAVNVGSGSPLQRAREIGGGYEILGFPLSEASTRELDGVDLSAQLHSLPDRALLVTSHRLPSQASFATAFSARGLVLPIETVNGPLAWIENRHTGVGAIPVNVLRRIVEWLG